MTIQTRQLLDRAFSFLCMMSIVFMAVALLIFLCPIFAKGIGAYVFEGTVEFRKMELELFKEGDAEEVEKQDKAARAARQPIYDAMLAFEKELAEIKKQSRKAKSRDDRKAAKDRYKFLRKQYADFSKAIKFLLGPLPEEFGEGAPVMEYLHYGATRMDIAEEALDEALRYTQYTYPRVNGEITTKKEVLLRKDAFANTALAPVFDTYLTEAYVETMLQPEWTFYPEFLTQRSFSSHILGGIGPEIKGTIFLTIGAMIFAIPLGVMTAVYLVEYAGDSWPVGVLRTCVSTLAGVPSVVFGLFGLTFFIGYANISTHMTAFFYWVQESFGFDWHINLTETSSACGLVGSMTLGLLILPTIIRASEEAIRAVPHSYKEAAMGLGASRARTVWTVILPAALPGILTGIVISMGRAAGETAPIIFTAAIAFTGPNLNTPDAVNYFFGGVPVLPFAIYSLLADIKDAFLVQHVQFGMVMTLITVVLVLNLGAIIIRARIAKNLRG